MPNLRDLATNLFNQGGQRVQQTVNPILLAIGNTGKIQTAPMRFGQSAWNSFKQAPQQLGTAVGTAITAPFELRRQNMEAATDRRIQDTLRLQQQRALKTGNIDQARQLAQRSAYYGDRTANNLQGFGENISQQRNNAIAGTVGTGLQLLGAKGMTPVKALQATAIPTVFGGGFAALTGGDIATGAGQGLGQSLQLAGINKITDPLLAGAQIGRLKFKGLNPAIAKMPLAKRALIKAGASGVINTAENELQTRVNEQRGQTPQEIALSFGMGAATGAGSELIPAGWKAGKEVVKETKQNTKIRFWNNALEMERQAIKEGNVQSRTARGQYGKMNKLTPTADFKGYSTDAIPLFEIELPNGQQIRITPSELYKRPDLQALRVVPSNDAAKRAFKMANSGGFIKPDEFIPGKVEEPKIDRTKLSGRQLDMTNAQLKEANQFQSDMEAQALNTQSTNTTSGTQTGKRPQVSQLFRAPEDLPSSQTSSPARENLDRLLQTRQEVFSRTGKSSQKSLVSSLPPEHYTELQQSFKDRTPDQKVNIIDYLRTPEKVLQKIGLGKEAELLKKQYNTYLDELPKEIGKITDWSKRVSPEANVRIFRYLDGQKDIPLAPEELKVATEIKTYLKEWADKLGLPQDSRIASYITHIFEKDIIQKEFDPEIARMIQDRVPGSVYDPFLQKRLGELGYVEDTWRALDAYVKRATRKYNMDQALEPLQAAAEKLDVDSYKYVERLGARINLRPTELDNLMDNTIKSVVGYRFGQRPVAAISRNIRQAVYRGTLGLNVGSAVRNLTQGVNTYSELGERYTIKGYLSLARDIASGSDELTRVGVLRDDFIQDRALSATKQSLQKLDKGLFALFEAAERINRGAAYYGAKSRALAQGKTEQQAIQEAIKLVEKTQFRFGSVDTPVAMQSDMAKLILQFQSYALKQGEFLAGKVANKEYAGLIRYALGSFVVAKTVGSLIGMDITDMIPGYGLATGEQKIGQTPAFQFGSSVVSAATDQPDKYGNKRTFKEKAINIGESAVPLIPAGVQIKKTIQGLDAVRKGYSESASGRVQYVVPQDAPTAVKAGLLGKSKLPQAQEYFKNKESVLSEKQSGIVKAASDKATEYKNIITTRKANREEDKVREEIKASGVGKQVGQQYVFLDTNGKTKSIDLNFNPTMPKLTGQAALDKKIIADYRGDITKKANDIQSLYEQGQLSAQQAEAQLKVLEQKALKVKKPKKPKKITVKTPKLKAIKLLKFKPIKVKKLKKIKFKKYKPKTIRV